MPFVFIFFQTEQNDATFYFYTFQNFTYINAPPHPNPSYD